MNVLKNMAQAVWGVCEPKPWKQRPAGRIRIKIRARELAVVYIKTANGIAGHYIAEADGFWMIGPQFGRNIREGGI